MPFQRLPVNGLNLGINKRVNPTELMPQEAVDILNMEWGVDDDLKTRKGAKAITSTSATVTRSGAIQNGEIDDPRWMVSDGTYLYVANKNSDSITIYDISIRDRAHLVGSISHADYIDRPSGMHLDTENDVLYVGTDVSAGGGPYVTSIDVSDPELPIILDFFHHADMSNIFDMVKVGNYLYLTCPPNDSLITLDVTAPAAMAYEHTLTDATNLNGCAGIVVDDTEQNLFVGLDDGHGLASIDISTPAVPSVAGQALDATNSTNCGKVVFDATLEICLVAASPTSNSGYASMIAFDVSTRSTPSRLSNFDASGGSTSTALPGGDIVISGYRAYFAALNSDVVYIVDISNPSTMVEENVLESEGTEGCQSIYYADKYLYVGSIDNDIIDIFFIDPGFGLSEWDSLQNGPTVFVGSTTMLGNYIYHSDNSNDDLHIYRVSDKEDITLVSTTNDSTYFADIRAMWAWTDGLNTYLAAFDTNTPEIFIWNVTNPAVPVLQVRLGGWGTGFGTGVQHGLSGMTLGGRKYLVAMVDTSAVPSNEFIRIYDVTDVAISGPSLRSKLLNPDPSSTFDDLNAGIRWLNGAYFVIKNIVPDWYHIIDMNDPDVPFVTSSFQRIATNSNDYCGHPDDDYLYIADNTTGALEIWSVADKTNPTYIHTIHTGVAPTSHSMFAIDDLLFQHDGLGDTVHATRITNREWPVRVAQYSATNVESGPLITQTGWGDNPSYDADENVLFVLRHEAADLTITAVDTRGLAESYLAQTLTDIKLDAPVSLRKLGQYMYVAAFDSDTLTVLDVNNAAAMTQVAFLTDGVNLNGIIDIEFSEDEKYIYCVNNVQGSLTLVDIQDPKHPAIRDTLVHASMVGAQSVAVYGTDAYVASDTGVAIIDCADPDDISLSGSLADGTNLVSPVGIVTWLEGAIVYSAVACSDRVTILDVTAPGSISVEDTHTISGGKRLRKDENELFVCSYTDDTIYVIDVTDPTAVIQSDAFTHADLDGPWDVWVDGNNKRIYVASENNNNILMVDTSDRLSLTHLKTFTDAKIDTPKAIWGTGSSVFVGSTVSNNVVYLAMSGFPLTNRVTSMFQFRDIEGDMHLLVTSGSDIFELNQTTGFLTSITGGLELPFNTLWDWVSYDGVAIGCNGGGDNKANPVYWEGTGTFADLLDAPDDGKFVEMWNDRVIIAGETAITWSKIGDPTDWTDPILSGALEPDSDYDSYITGLTAHRGYMVMFKQNNVYRIISGAPATNSDLWSVENIIRGHGCISGYTTQTILDDIVFLSKEGLISLQAALQVGDFQSMALSKQLPELRGLSLARDDYYAFVDPVNSQYHLSVSLDGTAGNTIVYVCDYGALQELKKVRWSTFDGDFIGASYASVLNDDNSPIVLIGGEDGTVYQRKLDADTLPYQDESGAFEQYVLGPEFNFQLPFKRKKVNRWGVSLRKMITPYTLALKVEIFLDGETSAAHTYNLSLDSTEPTIEAIRKLVGARGNMLESIQFKFSCVQANAPYRLDHYFMDTNALTYKRVDDA